MYLDETAAKTVFLFLMKGFSEFLCFFSFLSPETVNHQYDLMVNSLKSE